MSVQPQYLAYILEQLAGLPALRPNRMFGGVGLYSEGIFFGLIDDDTLFFKTGPANVEDYLSRKMPKFMPFPDKTGAVMGYHQVPADVIEEPESLVAWARRSVSVALSSKAAKAAEATKTTKTTKTEKPSKPKKTPAVRKTRTKTKSAKKRARKK